MHKLTRMTTSISSKAYKEAENKMENLRQSPIKLLSQLNGPTFVIAEWLR